MAHEPGENAGWCGIGQDMRESFTTLQVGGQYGKLPICTECWRQVPLHARAAIVAAFPLMTEAREVLRMVVVSIREAQLAVEEDDE